MSSESTLHETVRRRYRFARLGCLLAFWLLAVAAAVAADKVDAARWATQANEQVQQWQRQFSQWENRAPTVEEIDKRSAELLDVRQQSDSCVESFSAPLEAVQAKLKALGEQRPDESEEVRRVRAETERDKERIESQSALCRVVGVAAGELQAKLKVLRSGIVASALGERGNEAWHAFSRVVQQGRLLAENARKPFTWWPSLVVGIGVFFVLFPLANYLARLLRRAYPEPDPPASWKVGVLFAHMLARRLPWIASIISLATFAYLGHGPLIGSVLVALLLSLVLAPMIEMLLCQSVYRCVGGLPMRILLDLALIGLALRIGDIQERLTPDALYAAYTAYITLALIASLWLLFALLSREDLHRLRGLRLPLTVALLAGPLALWLGYRALADLLIPGIYGTLGGLLLLWMFYHPFGLLFTLLDTDKASNSVRLRGFLGYRENESVPGLWLARLLILVFLIALFGYWVLMVWQVPDSEVETLGGYLTKGFSIGSVTLVPLKIVAATVMFSLVLTLARWLRNQLSDRWLSRTRLDAGARQSIVALSTYAIVGVALLSALSMAGFDFQNLAIVAGALSVGIGFGLQNIVNNFVSGLILLFERPVRPGDWVVVGATEGFVKKVSIRSTQIQTFDRADVLVPNSELISSQVTNWMLRDRMGRVIVPVGVAYGSDTALVAELLRKVAHDHPYVLVNHPYVPDPQVLFMAFGDSSLDFELRCFISEVDRRLLVRSDLLFAIDREFRKADIEIPFPQRVVHMTPDESAPAAGEPPPGERPKRDDSELGKDDAAQE